MKSKFLLTIKALQITFLVRVVYKHFYLLGYPMSFFNSESEYSELEMSLSYDDDFSDYDDDFEDDFDEDYGESDDSLDEFDDDADLYYDDVFKEEEDVDEPYDDVEPEDGYSTYRPDASDELLNDDLDF